jgi:hypothetical protein
MLGLGDDTTDYSMSDPGGVVIPQGGSWGWGTIPSGSSTNWSSVISNLAASFPSIYKSIAGPLPSGCIQVAGPYGVSTQCGNNAAQPSLSLTSSLSSLGGISPIILIGGAIVVFMMMKKG